MPVAKMTEVSPLTDPNATTAPHLKGISGRKGTTQPLTERSYRILKERLDKQNKFSGQSPVQDGLPKLGLLLDRARIPRAIGVKMADLTESYNQQMWALVEAALSAEQDADEPFGPELEGMLEKSRATALRFQEALDSIERCYDYLRQESAEAVRNAAAAIVGMDTDDNSKLELLRVLFDRYQVDYSGEGENDFLTNLYESLRPRQTLLPLLKGANVYRNKKNTFDYLLSVSTKTNQSDELKTWAKTAKGTTIAMKYQVQPKFDTSVFSDHAGFVARFSCPGAPPLFVYYHSLEHGQQHTNMRTALSYGAQSGFSLFKQGSGTFDPDKSSKLSIHDHRDAFLGSLYQELDSLLGVAKQEQANVLLVVGECPRIIHEGILELVLYRVQSDMDDEVIGRVSELSVNVHGAKTQAPGFDLKFENASKSEHKGGKLVAGMGVHALTAYLFLNTQHVTPGLEVEASLLTLTDGTRQNLLTLKYGPQNELHAFTHLLNGKENALAAELKTCGYVTVGGDLNNLTSGTALVETCDREGHRLSLGSNSTSSEMYDKIVVL
ncbi:hypothetical protein LZ198_41150 [Myxococcus sp. K15C18031901]|uniref:hypothetical protein n=1 Tax=Myxococcus dinghuensis TaxID=2906761 RepID=UPI0020A6F76D|nr:hypothetical protein [Myxococcus dinghuensis]MCP3105296.1 hypothetical protein [Myxococcus dinghuensis]